MTSLATIHIAKKQLGLDDDTYRAILQRMTGKRSARDLSEGERRMVQVELERLGFVNAPRKRLEGRFATKLQALWISGWNLGVVREQGDAALLAFCERQTKISHIRFLRDADDARKAIEAIKAMLARDAGVIWPARDTGPAGQEAVIAAQMSILGLAERPAGGAVAVMQQLGRRIRSRR